MFQIYKLGTKEIKLFLTFTFVVFGMNLLGSLSARAQTEEGSNSSGAKAGINPEDVNLNYRDAGATTAGDEHISHPDLAPCTHCNSKQTGIGKNTAAPTSGKPKAGGAAGVEQGL